MNILFDHQTFSLQKFGGISRYYTELIQGINQKTQHGASLGAITSENVHLEEANFNISRFIPVNDFYKKQQLSYKINQLYSIVCLKKRSFDVFHSTYYDPYFLPYLRNRPFVVTFLDMIQEKFGKKFPGLDDGGITTNRKKILAHRADRIIAISESTKQDIVSLLNINPEKIDVVYLGSSLKKPIEDLEASYNHGLYILYVGRRERYKNFNGFLSAVSGHLKKHRLKLICAGGDSFTTDELALIHSLGVDSLVEQHSVNDKRLRSLYQKAIAFVFPSLYEGFGIPVLEAFSCGCPCIVSNISSLPEVAGDAALYIDPHSSDSIASAVERILSDSDLRNSLILSGYKQLAKFSWERTVNDSIAVYQSML